MTQCVPVPCFHAMHVAADAVAPTAKKLLRFQADRVIQTRENWTMESENWALQKSKMWSLPEPDRSEAIRRLYEGKSRRSVGRWLRERGHEISTPTIDRFVNDGLLALAVKKLGIDRAGKVSGEEEQEGEEPVPLREFIEKPQYLNLQGGVYPTLLDIAELCNAENTREAYLSMGKGSGKSTLAGILMARWVYELLCEPNPQSKFGLLPDSRLVILNLSTSKEQAKQVVFANFMARIRNSPWFTGEFDEYTTRCVFGKNIHVICGHSGSRSFIGYDTFRAVMDESSWMVDTKQHSVAEDIYDVLIGSLKTRYPQHYKLVAVSSPRTTEDWLTKEVEEVEKTGEPIELRAGAHTRIETEQREGSPGATEIHEQSGVGILSLPAVQKLLRGEEDVLEAYKGPGGTVAVRASTWMVNTGARRADYIRNFARTPRKALRDFACKPTAVEEPWLRDPSVLDRAVNEQRVSPLGDDGRLSEDFQPDEDVGYFVHIDLAARRDAAGLAMGHWCEKKHKCIVDLAMCFEAHETENLDFRKIRAVVYELVARGFNIEECTLDKHNSVDTIREFGERGVSAREITDADQVKAYDGLLELLIFDMLDLYPQERLLKELRELQWMRGDRLDHPGSGSKDIADSVAVVAAQAREQGSNLVAFAFSSGPVTREDAWTRPSTEFNELLKQPSRDWS